jgi:hypothetical protein
MPAVRKSTSAETARGSGFFKPVMAFLGSRRPGPGLVR